MSQRINPCPFCLRTKTNIIPLHYLNSKNKAYKRVCLFCGAEGPIGKTKAQATRLWNMEEEPKR